MKDAPDNQSPDELRSETVRRRVAFAMGPPRPTGDPCPRCGPGPSTALFETSLRTFYECLICRRPFGSARPSAPEPATALDNA
jgi:hypothetical protein